MSCAKACRASAKPVEILPNVLKSGSGVNQPRAGTAQIDVLKGDNAAVIQRGVNDPPETDLAKISFFDSDCASVYADEENEITYIPSSLRLLERLELEDVERFEKDRAAGARGHTLDEAVALLNPQRSKWSVVPRSRRYGPSTDPRERRWYATRRPFVAIADGGSAAYRASACRSIYKRAESRCGRMVAASISRARPQSRRSTVSRSKNGGTSGAETRLVLAWHRASPRPR